jgi:SAM-dependent methyltransferase
MLDMMAMRRCFSCDDETPFGLDEAALPLGWVCKSCGHVLQQRDGIPLTAPALADTLTGFDPADFTFLAQAEIDHFWFAARRRLISGLVDKYFPEATRFCEIGCGSGNVIGALATSRRWRRIVGTEIHTAGLSLARPRLPEQVELLQADARRMPLRDAFDLAGCFDVLEHIDRDDEVIAGIAAALVPGGGFIATVPQHPSLWSVSDDIAHHQRRYVRGELEAKLERAGFEILFSTSYTVFLLPMMALARVRSRKAAPDQNPRDLARREFNIPPRLNRILQAVLDMEVKLTLHGMRWPAGGSRVVVARKRAGASGGGATAVPPAQDIVAA